MPTFFNLKISDKMSAAIMYTENVTESVYTSAWIILDKELIQCHPATTYSNHHSASQDSYQSQFLRISKL